MKLNLPKAVGAMAVLALALSLPAPARQQKPEPATPAAAQTDSDRKSEAYYHFTMGHIYERLYEVQYYGEGRSEYANLAIDHYKKAYALDPGGDEIGARLAEMYAKAQRIRDAVLEANEVLKRDPDNLASRRLLARIYIRTLGERRSETAQRETLARAIEQYREILRIEPGDSESAVWLARLYRLQNDHANAERVLRDALARSPGQENLVEPLSQLLLDQGRTQEALDLLEKSSAGSSARVYGMLGNAFAQTSRFDRSEQAYRRAVELEPEDPSHLEGLARALTEQGKHAEALEQYRRLTTLEPEEEGNYLRMAQIYRRLRKLDQAEENIIRARQLAPGNVEVMYNEALIYEAQGRFDDSIRVLSTAVAGMKSRATRGEQNRRSLAALYEQLGRLYRATENFEAAVATFQEMGALGPDEAQVARAEIIESFRAGKQIDRAIAESERALAADPTDRGTKMAHAMLLAEKGRVEEAATMLRSLLVGGRDDRNVYLALAQAYERGRKFPDAEQAARQAERMSQLPGEKEMAWFLLGAIYERQKKFDLAESQFKKVLELNAHNAGALNYYGYMLADLGIRLEEATSLVKRALEEDAHNGAYLDSLGWAYYKQNRLSEAEESLRHAVQRSRFDPTIRDHLGDVLFKQGHIDQAAAEWERSLAEWQRSLPAEYDAEKVDALEKKLRAVKNRLAQQKKE